jgi:hypothetical protein
MALAAIAFCVGAMAYYINKGYAILRPASRTDELSATASQKGIEIAVPSPSAAKPSAQQPKARVQLADAHRPAAIAPAPERVLPTPTPIAAQAPLMETAKSHPFDFSRTLILEETGSFDENNDKDFWLNSGGMLIVGNGIAKTLQGDVLAANRWNGIYAKSNPIDTDNGLHPQNLFRLVTTGTWTNYMQEAYFRITGDHFSASENRDGHNGLLFFNRYKDDGQTLYYAGLRVDGNAIIKKKLHGTYYTMASKELFAGEYDRSSNPNLLPHNAWIGIRTIVNNNADGSVTVRLYTDLGRTGTWKLALEARDDGEPYGPAPILDAGHGGIRTDFMDVEIAGYKLSAL